MDTGNNSMLFENYEEAKHHLLPRIMKPWDADAFPGDIPKMTYLDLYLTCTLYNRIDDDTFVSTPVTSDNLKLWGIGEDRLFSDAMAAMRHYFPPVLISLDQMVELLSDEGDILDIGKRMPHHNPLYVLTNKERFQGAVYMMDDRILEEFSKKAGGEFCILPSSIHEVILIRTPFKNLKKLKRIVEEVNTTAVMEKDRLSDTVYVWKKDKGVMTDKRYAEKYASS